MFLLGVSLCILFLLQSSVSANTGEDGVKPVFLSHHCMHTYVEGKSHDGTPILLLHGLVSSKAFWKGIEEVLALKTGRRMCAADLRNHGTSPWNNRTDIEAMAADVAQLLDILKIKKAIIVGSSMGGKVAIHTALRYPEKVEKIIVEDMRPNEMTPESLMIGQAALNMFIGALTAVPEGANESTAREAMLKFINDKLELAFPGSNRKFSLDFLHPITLRNGTWDWQANARLFLQVLEKMWTESTGRFDGPAVFLYGTESYMKIPEDEINIRNLFPNAQLVPLKGAGHLVKIHPEYMKELLNSITSD